MGNYLERLRAELGLSLRHAARICKLSPGHLSKIEDGKLCAGLEILIRISQAYSIPIVAILREAGFVIRSEEELPPLAQYLRQRYQLSPQAIRDIELTKEVCDKKYSQATSARHTSRTFHKDEIKESKSSTLPFF